MAGMRPVQRQRWQELAELLERADGSGLNALTVEELKQLCRLYKHVTMDLSRARTDNDNPELVRYLNYLSARAHGHVYRARTLNLRPVLGFITHGFPRLVRQHAAPIFLAAAIVVLTSLASWLAVVRNPEVAYSLFDEGVVEFENIRLESEHGEYRGNFTFDVRQSPFVAVMIIANNIKVAVFAFAFGSLCCLPGVLLLVYNGRMLGTLSGLVWNHGYFIAFYSLILTHGVLELSAICIAGGGGLMLGWSLIAPGQLSRRDALRRAAGEGFGLLAGAALLLVVAGLIEAYVTPQFSTPIRWGVALTSAVLLAGYLGLAGRRGFGRVSPAAQSSPRKAISR
jgi:uncharacterized membrane protein SpoIIM required for sporulation